MHYRNEIGLLKRPLDQTSDGLEAPARQVETAERAG